MKIKFTALFLFLILTSSYGQVEDAWVYFNDKPNAETYIAAPLTMLTQRSLDRRIRYNIALDFKDVPLDDVYVATIAGTTGITVLSRSKWLNALHIQGLESDIQNLLNFPFVERIEFANKLISTSGKNKVKLKSVRKTKNLDVATDFNYGLAANQIEMLNGNVLHQNDFSGDGMQIAVIDAGFPNVTTFDAFKRVRDNNQVIGGYNFVDRSTNFYARSLHGTSVLSTIAGFVENQFVGTAPDADFYLFITEDDSREVPLEESLWVEAVEKADSLGVDIINSSLGYSNFFDNTNYNYSYNDMDGKTAFVTKGAEVAFSRGMIIVNSVGNEGNDAWKYMNAPADGASVLSIGAVNSSQIIASFSSFGPTSDDRIKPDICAQGAGVYVINSSGAIATSNGTSFSSPVMAGMVACLWQAFPTKTNVELTKLIKESSHLYNNPTSQEGYGIPNFQTIFNLLNSDENNNDEQELSIYPNPAENIIYFNIPKGIEEIEVRIIDLLGKEIWHSIILKNNAKAIISQLTKGLYLVQVKYKDKVKVIKLLKK